MVIDGPEHDPVARTLAAIRAAASAPVDPVAAMLERIGRLGRLSPEEQAAELDRLRREGAGFGAAPREEAG